MEKSVLPTFYNLLISKNENSPKNILHNFRVEKFIEELCRKLRSYVCTLDPPEQGLLNVGVKITYIIIRLSSKCILFSTLLRLMAIVSKINEFKLIFSYLTYKKQIGEAVIWNTTIGVEWTIFKWPISFIMIGSTVYFMLHGLMMW